MARLTEEMVIARSKQSDLAAIKKLNCWGAELGDISLLRRMPNVEVLALSINKIRSLGDFAGCRRLRELYIRKNEIRDLREIRHLRNLPELTSLWLDENPCTHHPEYRMTVLRNLPNLEKLDNVSVHPEEVSEAMRRGAHIPDSDDEGYPQQEAYSQYRRQRSCDSSPEREREPEPEREEPYYSSGRSQGRHEGSDSSEGAPDTGGESARQEPQPCPLSPTRRTAPPAPVQHSAPHAPPAASPDSDERYSHPAMTRSQYDSRGGPRSPDEASLRHSLSAHNVKEYAYSMNGECRYGCEQWRGVTSPQQQYEGEREYSSAVMAERRGFTRRPVTRNSNLLSAVLCLVKELDYPSLEVAEMAVRCRMDELANGQ